MMFWIAADSQVDPFFLTPATELLIVFALIGIFIAKEAWQGHKKRVARRNAPAARAAFLAAHKALLESGRCPSCGYRHVQREDGPPCTLPKRATDLD